MQKRTRGGGPGACAALVALGLALVCSGCGSTAPTRTGFLGDYERLGDVRGGEEFVSPALAGYRSFIVEAVEFRGEAEDVRADHRSQLAAYLRARCVGVVEDAGLTIVEHAGSGVGRVRLALTGVRSATWWLNLHPGSKITGAGTGGASIEAEIVDSITGEQLAAASRVGRGNQFELDAFSELDDVKDVIDAWAEEASRRVKTAVEADTKE
ncbi:MAG: lipoprotein [Phycisphaeraceae bacterium]|nr:MAG: lipoprotein [Phycisphaeraceae bacterium]